MRFIANENIPRAAVSALATRGHDIFWIRTEKPGTDDTEILEIAQRESRILLTFDKDFGELAFRYLLPADCGIILLRFSIPSAKQAAKVLVNAIESRDDRAGHFSVIEDDRVRMTPMPEMLPGVDE